MLCLDSKSDRNSGWQAQKRWHRYIAKLVSCHKLRVLANVMICFILDFVSAVTLCGLALR